ncbi:hypothetical protein IFR05_015610 [Cadophora sp. M221]|nr:hypothetical protein IFR05_015610 [Cadophora sp. M221]
MEYRQELNNQRSLQRIERKWFFTMVEVGAASNFLADELLKTRAGENVLALLSALIPHLEESAFPQVLMETFEHFGIPAESTPGMGQLSKVRAALAAYASRMDFKDRVLLSHKLFSSLNTSFGRDPTVSVPPPRILPKAISMLYKVAISDQHILHVSGFQGAAWIATYATHILGLGACVVLGGGEILSMTASYEDSKVIFFIGSVKKEITLWREREIEELISMDEPDQAASNWLVSCDRVSYLQYHCPNMRGRIRESMSHFVTAKSFGAIQKFLGDIPTTSYPDLQFEPFMKAFTSSIQDRAVEIIRALGFSPEDGNFYRSRFAMAQEDKAFIVPSQTAHFFTVDDGKLYFGAMFWTTHETFVGLSTSELTPTPSTESQHKQISLENLFAQFAIQISSLGGTETKLREEDIPRGLLHILNNTIEFASTLAFTDWNLSNRQISTEFLSNQPIPQRKVGGTIVNPPFEAWQQKIMHRAIEFSTSMTYTALEKKLWWVAEWLGQDYGGIVVVRHLACSQDLFNLPGCLATFHPGHIAVDGERFQDFREELDSPLHEQQQGVATQQGANSERPSRITASIPEDQFCCADFFPDLRLQTVVKTTRDSVWIKSHLIYGSTAISPVSPSRIANNTTKLLVTSPCSHDDNTRPLTRTSVGGNTQFKWGTGLFLDQNVVHDIATSNSTSDGLVQEPRPPLVHVHLQQVNNNRLGQWAAMYSIDPSSPLPCVQILQRDSCLDCILSQLSAAEFGGRKYQVLIISNTGSINTHSGGMRVEV